MQDLHWKQDMSLGVPAMDEAHKAFLDELAELLIAPDDGFATAFVALVAKIETDFQEEEALMEDIEYSGIRGHREQHARVLAALHHIVPRVMSGDLALGREAVELLPQWFLFHLSTMDTALAFAIDMNAQEHLPPALRIAEERRRHDAPAR